MPNRIIREGWCESEHIAQLAPTAERLLLRLCLRADDFGRFTANPRLILAAGFPLLVSEMTEADVSRDLAACEEAGCIRRYQVDGKAYLVILKFNQRMRAARSKCPPPPDSCQTTDGQVEGNCHADGARMTDTCQAGGGHPRTEAETHADSEPHVEAEPHADSDHRAARAPVRESTAPQPKPKYAEDWRVHDAKRFPLPPGFDAPEIRAAWVKWIEYLVGKWGPGAVSTPTLQQHIALLKEWGPGIAVAVLKNSWGRNLREPGLPRDGAPQKPTRPPAPAKKPCND